MKEIVIAGFGGQGVLTCGLVIAEMAVNKDFNTVWMPSYGPAMRGGKANCIVKYGENPGEKVGSPVMECADVLIAMNEPALDFIEFCKPNATIIVNTHSISENYKYPSGYKFYNLDCVDLANKINNPKGQSIVMSGAFIKSTGLFSQEHAQKSIRDYFTHKGKGKFADLNIMAFDAGYNAI